MVPSVSQEGFLSAVLDTVNALIVVLDREGCIVRFNRACEQATGFTFSEVQGRVFSDVFLLPDESAGVQQIFDALLKGQRTNQHENHWITRDGRARLISWTNTVLTEPDGSVAYIVATGLDITERRKAEEALRRSEERYSHLFHNHHSPMLLIDPASGDIVDANPAASSFYGWSREELTRRKITDINILPPEKTHQEMRRTQNSSNGIRFFFQHRLASGEIRDVEVYSGPVLTGEKELLFSIIHDVTERKRIEDEIKNISLFPEENPDPVMRFDRQGKLLYANPASSLLLACWDSEVGEIVSSHVRQKVEEVFRKKISSEIEVNCSERIYELLLIYITGAGYVNGYGKDVTARRKAETALHEYAVRLQTANQELQAFAHIASHDLQEPLRKIQAFGERLNRQHQQNLDEEGLDYLQRMTSAAGRMDEMLRGLLTFARVTTQAKPAAHTDLNQIVQEALVALTLQIQQASGTITIDPLPQVDADPDQMRQLFYLLIDNALKFRPTGQSPEIFITGQVSEENDARWAEISVRDNGIGFDEAYLERIFQPFQRLHGRSEYEGYGMGLAISRKIVERHGGTITARSQPGEGATFIVRLPAAPA